MIQKLRTSMLEQKLDMLVVVSADEHLNEYPPVQNCRLRASTSYRSSQGFRGSAGTAVFCVEGRPQLFVDSRYHIQAEQSCGENFEIQKLGNDGVLAPQEWIASHLGKTLIIGADPYVMSPNEWRSYEKNVKKAGHILKPTTPNLVDTVWDDRPNSLKN
ncbi:MAG: aminopeptidase P family N-terminal domain-containing protein, partial [SAR324 cluster bacterium]|nr:aminopeptidase P family N-terminal domain-containing protein [SAR324 cluster bacterium]